MHPLVILSYRFLHPTSLIAEEARAVGAYNDAPAALKPQRLQELANYLVAAKAFVQTGPNSWHSRTKQVEVTRDSTGHGVTIYGGNILGDTALTPEHALKFISTVVESLPGDRRISSSANTL